MTYIPSPAPGPSIAALRDWTTAELAKVAAAIPNQLVIDAAGFNLPVGKDTDATPAFEQMLKKIPEGALVVFTQPGNLTFKQELAVTARSFVTFTSLRSARSGTDDTRTTFRWAGPSGGRAFYVQSCHQVGFVNIAFHGNGEDILVECDDNGVNGISGSRCFWNDCTFTDPLNRLGHRGLYISRTARGNQEWHRVEGCDFSGCSDTIFVGGRRDATNAGNVTAGSDVFTINGPMLGEGQPPTLFASKFLGYDLTIACGPDGKTQFRPTVKAILSPTSVQLSAPAPLDGPNCYFALTNARGYGISVGQSANSLKHRFVRSEFTDLKVGIESAGGSFHSSECIYGNNNQNIVCVGQMEPSCDECPTCESSLQHLFLWSDNGFELKGPGRLALSTPMPAAPFIAFGEGAMCCEIDHFNFQDVSPLPKGSTVFDPTRALSPNNDPCGQPPLLQLLLRCNRYWFTRADLGLYQPFTGPQQIRRMMESDFEPNMGQTFDETITKDGVVS